MQFTLQTLVLIYKVQTKQKLLLFPMNFALGPFIKFWRFPALHFRNHSPELLAVSWLEIVPLSEAETFKRSKEVVKTSDVQQVTFWVRQWCPCEFSASNLHKDSVLKKTHSLLTQRNLESKPTCWVLHQIVPALLPSGRFRVIILKGNRTDLIPATPVLLLFCLQCYLWWWESETGIRGMFSRDGALLIYNGTWIWAHIYIGPVEIGACSYTAHSGSRKVGTCLEERREFLCVLNQMKHKNPHQELWPCEYWDLTEFFQNNRVPHLQARSSAWRGRFYKQCTHIWFPSYQNFPACQLLSPSAVPLHQAQIEALALLCAYLHTVVNTGMLNSLWETSKRSTALSC